MRRRMILSYALILLVFAVAAYFFVIRTVYGMIRDNIIQTAGATMDRWSDELESVLLYGKGFLLTGAADAELQNVMRISGGGEYGASSAGGTDQVSGGAGSSGRALEEIGNSRIIYPESTATKHMPAYMSVLTRDADGTYRTVYSAASSMRDRIYFPEDPWLAALLARNGRFLFSPYATDDAQYLRLSKVVYDNEHPESILGVAALDFDYDHLSQYILTPLRVQGGIEAGLYDRSGEAFIGYRRFGITEEIRQHLAEKGTFLISGGRAILCAYPVRGTEISILGVRSLSDARTAMQRALRTLLLTAAVIFAVALCFSFFMTHRISKPILEEQYLMRLRQDQLEMSALQSQIHTHFLYNTLDTINWMALDHDAPDISHLVTNLSNLLRKSLNRGRSELSVRDEISHVRSYLAIQQVRFPDAFRTEIKADESLMDDMVLKMLLQPLVENAILHVFNVNHLDQRDNLLRIAIGRSGERLSLAVSNNAGEEDYRKVDALMRAETTPDMLENIWSGYGIISIRERLHIAYGGHASIAYGYAEGVLRAEISIDRAYTAPGRTLMPNLPEGNVWDTVS